MTERFLTHLSYAASSENAGQRAYLDLWRTLNDNGFKVNFTSDRVFPRANRKRGNAFIPQSTIEQVIRRRGEDFEFELDHYRQGKAEPYGGLINGQLINSLEAQLPRRRQSLLNRFDVTGRSLRFAAYATIGSLAADHTELTPALIRGSVRDTFTVPVMATFVRFSKNPIVNAGILTGVAFLWEGSQKIFPQTGTFDFKDLGSFVVGAASYAGFREVTRRMDRKKLQASRKVKKN